MTSYQIQDSRHFENQKYIITPHQILLVDLEIGANLIFLINISKIRISKMADGRHLKIKNT